MPPACRRLRHRVPKRRTPLAYGLYHGQPSGKAKDTSIAAVNIAVVGTAVRSVVSTDAVDDAFDGSDPRTSLPPLRQRPIRKRASKMSTTGTAGPRDNSLHVVRPVSNADWDFTLGTPREAWQEVHAERMEYWIVPVTATYTGEETASPGVDVTVQFIGSDNRTHDDYCGGITDPLDDIGYLQAVPKLRAIPESPCRPALMGCGPSQPDPPERPVFVAAQ